MLDSINFSMIDSKIWLMKKLIVLSLTLHSDLYNPSEVQICTKNHICIRCPKIHRMRLNHISKKFFFLAVPIHQTDD